MSFVCPFRTRSSLILTDIAADRVIEQPMSFVCPFRTRSSLILTDIAADRVIGRLRLVDRRGCCFPFPRVPLTFHQQLIDALSSRIIGALSFCKDLSTSG